MTLYSITLFNAELHWSNPSVTSKLSIIFTNSVFFTTCFGRPCRLQVIKKHKNTLEEMSNINFYKKLRDLIFTWIIIIIIIIYNGYRVFTRGKAAGAWCWPPTPSKRRGHERVELYLYSPSGPSWPVIGRPLSLPFIIIIIIIRKRLFYWNKL